MVRNKPDKIINDVGATPKAGEPQVPCFFIFGDSLVNAGNNNRLTTLARANYDPYGIDFKPLGATGRFTNGKTTVDFMGVDGGIWEQQISRFVAGIKIYNGGSLPES